MVRTFASDSQHIQLAQFFVERGHNMDQAYRWLRQHKYMIKDRYYKATAVLTQMQLLTQSK
jgi:hypothetical protein